MWGDKERNLVSNPAPRSRPVLVGVAAPSRSIILAVHFLAHVYKTDFSVTKKDKNKYELVYFVKSIYLKIKICYGMIKRNAFVEMIPKVYLEITIYLYRYKLTIRRSQPP